jgi:hypothetical protein
MIDACLRAAGVTRVIWIDDHFAAPSRESDLEGFFTTLRNLHGNRSGDLVLPNMPRLSWSTPFEQLQEECETALGALKPEEVHAVAVALANEQLSPEAVTVNADISPEDYGALIKEFGDRVVTMSFAQWSSTGEEEHGKAGKDTLFLIDKEFSNEDTSYTGLDILQKVTQSSQACCILFTHRSTEGEEDENRRRFAQESKLEIHRFAVVAKFGAQNPITSRFARALRSVFMHRQTGDLAHRLAIELQKSLTETCTELVSQSITDVDQALFENSIEEGASELDVLLRILILKQRHDAHNAFKGDLGNLLLEIRKFRAQIAGQAKDDPAAPMDKFREWRKWEVFEEGDLINPIHAPLSCGDIFECTSVDNGKAVTKRFVLLSQPCDLMVRSDGHRVAEVGLFVLVREEQKTESRAANSAHRIHEIDGVFADGLVWRIDFLYVFVVDLSLLDLSVLNPDGAVSMRADATVAEYALTPGYAKTFARLKKDIQSWLEPKTKALPRILSLGKNGKKYSPRLMPAKVEYPVRRVGRLEPATAQSILAAWASYQTRAALDHDFARGCSDSIPTPAAAAPLPETKGNKGTEGPKPT